MPNYNSYYLYQKFIKYPSNPDAIPVIPTEFSLDADGSMPLVLNIENDAACGYKPPVEPIYRWNQLPISEDYECSGGTKYYKEVYQVSYNNGLTWEDVVPEQTRRGDVYETGSSDCIEYRWINLPIAEDYICDDCPEAQYRWTVSTGYVCSGTNKMTREIEEVSYDSGTTWTATGNERAALPVIEADSTDCGYVPPTPSFNGKWLATYTGGNVTSAECDSTSAISQNEITLTDLESVIIGDCVTNVGAYAFGYCSSLTSVTIPDSVTNIGERAFYHNYSLTSVNIPNSVTRIRDEVFDRCSSLTSVSIPNSVTSISYRAFHYCSGLTSITIPDSVTSIGNFTFGACSSLTSVTIPDSVTYIGKGAFDHCSGLTSVAVDVGNTVYDSRNNCNAIIETATNKLIAGCKNTVIPNSVTSIGDYAFGGSSLTGITIPTSVTSIGDYAFHYCSGLTSITIPDSVTSIGNNAFYSCTGLTSVTIGTGVTSIGDYAFEDCFSLTSATIGTGVTSIGNSAFNTCTSLTSITIPNSVTSIGNSAFNYCTGLTSVTVEATTPPTLGSSVFSSTNNCPIYVPASSVSAYRTATIWSAYASRIQAIS